VWLRHYGDSLPHRFAVVRRGDRPCAAALLVTGRARRSRIPLVTLHLGTAGGPQAEEVAVERNGLLCRPEDLLDEAAALTARLHAERGFSELRLDGWRPDHYDAFAAAEPSLTPTVEPSPCVDLAAVREAADDDGLLATLPKRTGYHVRRSLRVYGDVHGEWATTADAAHDIFEELVRLHQARWEAVGQPGAFASPRRLGFARELIDRLIPADAIQLYRVRSATETIGCLYNVRDGDDMLFWQGGLAHTSDNRCKPGYVTHVDCMRACAERGLAVYDLLCGDAPYKRALSSAERELVWARGMPRGARVALADGLRAARGGRRAEAE
jgi:CelD/BcsL family acetyltransferase involved in cellulose biosynthesis